MPERKKYAVIVAGGKGQRMGSAVPKQFLPLLDKPILYWTLITFLEAYADMHIILVLPADETSYAQMVLAQFPERPNIEIVNGGETRFYSVQNGLKHVAENSVVFIHDGVRPLVSVHLIRCCYEQALQKGSAIPAIAVTDSMRVVNRDDTKPVDREQLRIIQTPQTFLSEIILPAFQQPYQESFTDEATVAEAFGTKIFLINGERANIKVTTPEDMLIAEALLKNEQK